MVTGGKNVGCWIGLFAQGLAKEREQNVAFLMVRTWKMCGESRRENTTFGGEQKIWCFFNCIFWEMKFDFGG
jgi:hypothetical protein